MNDYKINIVHLYPDLLNLYGDKGNIECLKKRLTWRNIEVNVTEISDVNPQIDFENSDIIFLGGGSDREQKLVCAKLSAYKSEFKAFVEKSGTLIALCGGFEMIGKSFGKKNEKCEALGILDFDSEYPSDGSRLIGNVIMKCEGIDGFVVGFENHCGRIVTEKYEPLGKIIKGYGSNGINKNEGLVYKNLFASYLHGPLFPKNPKLCDLILTQTLKNKYSDFDKLSPLDDNLEEKANNYITQNLL